MAPQYKWITFVQARQQLALRLADAGNVYWTDTENGLYLVEALRTWNSLVGIWNAEVSFQAPLTNGQIWYSVPSIPNSPRVRTVSFDNLFTIIEYHLLEPPTGSAWTGTPQFSIDDLLGAVQRRRDEVIQLTDCNLVNNTSIVASAGSRRAYLPDTTLEVRRCRYVPQTGFGVNPMLLWREDAKSFEYFQPGYLQSQQKNPRAYDVIAGPPLSLDLDLPPAVNGTFDLLLLQSVNVGVVGMPDDFTWVVKFGALSDLLGRDSEATDELRAQYCLQRYTDGLKWMAAAPWITLAELNGVATGTPSVFEMDSFSAEWDSNSNAPTSVVTAGVDMLAISPVPPTTSSPVGVTLTLIGNAPVPVNDADFVQISRDAFDMILDYAQHLAAFKMGGAEFVATKELAANFFKRAMSENSRLAMMGLFRDVLLEEGQREHAFQERFDKVDAG